MLILLTLSSRQMKAHFDTPGVSQVESLNHLALGMNRKGAALLFYQTCGTSLPMHNAFCAHYHFHLIIGNCICSSSDS